VAGAPGARNQLAADVAHGAELERRRRRRGPPPAGLLLAPFSFEQAHKFQDGNAWICHHSRLFGWRTHGTQVATIIPSRANEIDTVASSSTGRRQRRQRVGVWSSVAGAVTATGIGVFGVMVQPQ
jgi:hypothetical protein